MSTPVLEIVDLRKSFDQNLVLHDVLIFLNLSMMDLSF